MTNKIRSVAIVLCDNDFGQTFRPLLESIHNALWYNDELSQNQVEFIIRRGIEYHYLAFQNVVGAPPLNYLSKIEVLFNKNADNATLLDHDGGSWHLDVSSGQINSF